MEHMGIETRPRMSLRVDASAAIAMLTRDGLGPAKHVDTQFLWVQEAIREGRFRISKVSTHHNPADMLTKQLSERKVVEYITALNCRSPYDEPKR